MSNDLVYNGVLIRDRDEMLSLTDMWRAAGSPNNREPYQWERKEGAQFIEFIWESLNLPIEQVWIAERGRYGGGTWAHWQVGLAYAKYLSPPFHAKVNKVFRERMEEKLRPAPLSEDEIIFRAHNLLSQRVEALQRQVEELKPDAAAYQLLAEASEGSVNVTVGAKILEQKRPKLINWLISNDWMYRDKDTKSRKLVGYAPHIKNGDLEHVLYPYYDHNTEETRWGQQVFITVKGLAKLAKIFGKTNGAASPLPLIEFPPSPEP